MIINVVGEIVHLVDDTKFWRLEVLAQRHLNKLWCEVVDVNAPEVEVQDKGGCVGYMRLVGHGILRI